MFLEPVVISPSYMDSQVTFSLDGSPLGRRPDLRVGVRVGKPQSAMCALGEILLVKIPSRFIVS